MKCRANDGSKAVAANAAKTAFDNIRKGFEGEAERLGIKDEQDVVALVDETRKRLWKEWYENND